MKQKQRIQEAQDLYKKIQSLHEDIKNTTSENELHNYRLQLATLEKQISLLRMLQGENRLSQALFTGAFGFIGVIIGIIVTKLI